tara:strand:- start:606 stop:917 length:312 start_codon:yes stop_codon:yes gene_type:complete
MNLQELKNMIAEEFSAYNEQEIAVSDADVDVDAMGGDAESQLREIYEMLKAYFEGGDGGVEAPEGLDDVDMDGGMDDDMEEPEEDEAEALQERFKKLANIIKG